MISDNEFFKELIDDASTSQDVETSFNQALYEQLRSEVEDNTEELIEALQEIILKEVFNEQFGN